MKFFFTKNLIIFISSFFSLLLLFLIYRDNIHFIFYFTILFIIFFYFFYRSEKRNSELIKNLELEKLKFEKLLDTNLEGIHLLDKKGNVIFCNKGFANMLGYSYEEAKKLNISNWNNSAKNREEEYINVALKNDGINNYNTHNIKKDGTQIDVNVNATNIVLDGKEYFYASSRDITKLLDLQEKAKLTQNLKKTQELAKICSFSHDLQSDEILFSDYFYKLLNIEKDKKILFSDFLNMIHPDDVSKVEEARLKNETENYNFELEFRVCTSEGLIKYIYANWQNIKNESKVIFVEGYLQDVTEKEISKKRDKLQSKLVLKQNNDLQEKNEIISKYVILSSTNLDGVILEVSDAFCKLSGYSKEELIGKTHRMVRHKNTSDELISSIWNKITNLKTWQGIIENRAKDGTSYFVDATIYPQFNKNGEHVGYISTRVDITQNILAQNKQKEQELMLIQQNRLAQLGEMISMIAHQWRQPLTILVSKLDKLKVLKELDMLDDETFKNQHQSIRKNIEHMSSTIEDFRNFYKEDKEKKDFNLAKTIDSMLELIGIDIYKNKISLDVKIDESLIIHSNESELKQVILSLVSNAKDALLNNNKENKYVKIYTLLENKRVFIFVEDNAGGIPLNIQDKVFEPYFTTKSDLNGTGLGLYMAKMVVEKSLNGIITFEVNKVGTIFKISLPFGEK